MGGRESYGRAGKGAGVMHIMLQPKKERQTGTDTEAHTAETDTDRHAETMQTRCLVTTLAALTYCLLHMQVGPAVLQNAQGVLSPGCVLPALHSVTTAHTFQQGLFLLVLLAMTVTAPTREQYFLALWSDVVLRDRVPACGTP